MKTEQITMRMPEDVASALRDVARQDERSLAWLVIKIAREWLAVRATTVSAP